jgi:glycosyltransferase involved in cell wall biosynthesis
LGLRALVITPTTGAPELEDAIKSVSSQTYTDVDHLVVCDGEKFKVQTDYIVNKVCEGSGAQVCYLPYNTGGDGFYGHRIMAAFSHLVNHDVVLFLDQDNWFEPTHVETLVNEIKMFNLDWAYSLRKIYDKDKTYICDDNCESLGRWPVWVNDEAFLIDSSSYCFKTDFIRKIGHTWDWGWGADRRFYTIVKESLKHQNYTSTGKHTLCYRLGGNEGSVTGDFFVEGNKKITEKYKGKLPWVGGR